MSQAAIDRLLFLCDTIPTKVRQLPDATLIGRPQVNKWSKKEILGHLIDSAANNHQRFVRGQFEERPVIYYEQDAWVAAQDYQYESSEQLIALWEAYNRHLAYIIARIPADALTRQCLGRNQQPCTLAFLIDDYVQHLEHHLRQIVSY